jgi:hypothetical protein
MKSFAEIEGIDSDFAQVYSDLKSKLKWNDKDNRSINSRRWDQAKNNIRER